MQDDSRPDFQEFAQMIKEWAKELGFQQAGIADLDLRHYDKHYHNWLAAGRHAGLGYMERNIDKRLQPEKLHPGTARIISVRMNYLTETRPDMEKVLEQGDAGYVSRYALGRDYHKLIRKRLQKLADRINSHLGGGQVTGLDAGRFDYRAFVDSAPVLEKAIAEKCGIGWIGKNTLVLNEDAGSWFFLGELFTNIPLPVDAAVENRCGNCSACISCCPTGAIEAPYQLNAGKCISYLTIENREAIPVEWRKAMGNRIFGCDDCQVVCPWNRFAKLASEGDFTARHGLDSAGLLELFEWSEEAFLLNTEGSAIRRAGYSGWLRNLAVALGNAPYSRAILQSLEERKPQVNEMVAEHIQWAIGRQLEKETG